MMEVTTNHLEIQLCIIDSEGNPSTITTVIVENSDGINLEEAAQELRAMLARWGQDWLEYPATTKTVIMNAPYPLVDLL